MLFIGICSRITSICLGGQLYEVILKNVDEFD